MAAFLSLAACSDAAVNACLEDSVGAHIAQAQASTTWQDEIDSVVASSPADYALDVVVLVSDHRWDFTEWAALQEVAITYAFYLFSAYRISPSVSDLLSLKEVPGVTSIDWDKGTLYPSCLPATGVTG